MTFGIQSSESLLEGLRREVDDQVRSALDELSRPTDLGGAIHGCRRTLKRARALLKLARPALTSDAYVQGKLAMRDAGRCVAPLRDADVLVETARSMCGQRPNTLFHPAWAQLLEELEEPRDALFATAAKDGAALSGARDLLQSIDIAWPEAGEPDDGELLRTGLAASYRSVRAHAERATASGWDASAHHELRKKSKDLRHQLEFLSPTSPETLVPMAEAFHRLTDLLGDANDLAVLATCAWVAPSGSRARRSRVLPDLDDRRESLLQEAGSLSARLLAESVADFVGRVEECWVGSRPQG